MRHHRAGHLRRHPSRRAEDRPQGPQFASWDATNDKGGRVRAGLYFYSLTVDGERRTKAMTFVP